VANLFIGKKPGIGIVVKIMKNDADDPLTTPISDIGKFKFSSEISEYSYINKIDKLGPTLTWAASSPAYGDFTPVGDTLQRYTASYVANQNYYQIYAINITSIFGGWPPLIEKNLKDVATGWLGSPFTYQRLFSSGSVLAGTWTPGYGYRVGYDKSFPDSSNSDTRGILKLGVRPNSSATEWSYLTYSNPNVEVLFTYFDLIGDNSAIPALPIPSASGDTILIDENQVKISKANYTIDQVGYRTQIVNSNKSPCLILASGTISMAANTNQTIVPIYPLSDSAYIGVIASADAHPSMTPPMLMDYSGNQNGQDITGFRYKTLSGNLVLENNNPFSVNVKYICSADEKYIQTFGGVNIIEEKTDANGAYFVIKTPGSSDVAPSLNEILLDTRLTAMRIIAEGYSPRASFTLASSNLRYGDARLNIPHVNLNNDYKTFVMYRTLLENNSWTEPKTVHLFNNFNFQGTGRGHSVCVMNETSTDFYISNNAASFYNFNSSSSSGGVVGYSANDRVEGIRYYIFAIPN
jgi:hypothetical protein